MIIIPESFKAYQYQTGIDRIRDAYRASADTINKAVSEATLVSIQHLESDVDDREYDEDGILLYSTAHSLAQAEMDAILAVTVVRRGVHHERLPLLGAIRQSMDGTSRQARSLRDIEYRERQKYPLSPQLENLNLLNNLLKHNSHRVDRTLLKSRPDYFGTLFPTTNVNNPPEPRLRLSHEHVEEAFDIVKASGPTH
ncbi:hypothetical protein A4U53_003830 (plasmid) [Rhizobium ruizarguesonis]|uniref:Uncharacterized protein n=1 Tax=Rhizobium ruizarguesonis TaxID=2081791 RepID=A0ACD5EGF2_9HYPH